MKNKLLKKGSILLALMISFAMTQTMNAQYCVPEGTNSDRFIDNFSTTNGVDNISNLGSGFSTAGYGDFYDTHTLSQTAGGSVDFSVDIEDETAGFRIWVDWNQDGVFDVANEVAYTSSSYDTSHSGTISVPANALEGETRMRVVSHWLSSSGDTDPCVTGFTYGEFEDYKFIVTGLTACTGTPDGGVASVDPTSGNPGSTYTVSAQNYTVAGEMTYLWQSNTNNAGWEDHGTASAFYEDFSATASSEVGDITEWRLEVTCTASGETSYSDVSTFSTEISYCGANSSTVEAISKVVFAGIDNDSPVSSTEGYEDFTAIVAQVEAGGTYSFAAEGNTGGNFTNYFSVWIDWNQNGEFETSEFVEIGSIVNSDGTDGQQAVNDIVVPSDAVEGETRMRIRKNFNTPSSSPCGTNTYGQVEDYTVNVVGAAPFPSPYCEIEDAADVIVEEITKVEFAGTTITNEDTTSVLVDKTDIVVNVTAGETYTLSVEGNTYGDFETNIVAFIDWNQNDILDDSGEIYELGTLQNSTGDDGISVSMDILVPSDAVVGATRVRITKTYFDDLSDAIVTPCGIQFDPFGMGIESGYGQALDFSLEVEEASTVDCSGTPEAGIATVTPEEGEVDTEYTVAAAGFTTGTGLEYQWQSNTDGAGWVNEGAASDTFATYLATAPSVSGVTVEWRLEVTCTLSSETAYSEIATFTTIETSLYCIPTLDCSDGDNIVNVTFQEIDNTTDCSAGGYGDYTSMAATVEAGSTYPISVTVGDGWDVESASVWIDFDNSGSFDENEFFYIGTGSGETLTENIAIPADAADGNYRMRVRVAAVPDTDATWDMSCDEDQGYGETEDYTVTVDGVAGINDYTSSNFTYFPNPMENELNITSNKNIESISVYNLLGQVVMNNVNFAAGKVDVSSLSTGTFLFRVTFEDGVVENFKVLKK